MFCIKDEALASYEQYIDCMDTYIDTGSGLFMKNWLADGVNYAVVVTDGSPLPADLRDTGFWACTAWTDMDSAIEIIETNNMDSSVLLAFADFCFPIGSSDSVRSIVLDSAWEGFGDFDSDGAVDSGDAAEMLIRAAALGAADALHTNADLLGDLNNDGELNAADAAAVLTYAAEIGAGSDVSWLDILR